MTWWGMHVASAGKDGVPFLVVGSFALPWMMMQWGWSGQLEAEDVEVVDR